MGYLLDTNILIRLLTKPNALGKKTRHILFKSRHQIFFSSISTAEISIKRSRANLNLVKNWQDHIEDKNFTRLDFNHHHATVLEQVGWHHRDPFDRMLIAQAKADNLIILTMDEMFTHYDVNVICNE